MPTRRISSSRCHAGNAHGVHCLHRNSLSAAIPVWWISVLTAVLTLAIGGPTGRAADDAPGTDTTLPEPPAVPPERALPAFQPEDISIGEPISLPRATPLAVPAPGRPPVPPAMGATGSPFQTTPAQLPSVIAPASPATTIQPARAPADTGAVGQAGAAGSGWLGIAVDDTLVTGRLVVVEVAPDGPAAKAGVRQQDMLLAINGNPLKNGDELAAALAAIVAGQQVKMAVGRDNRVEDVVARASARPPDALSRDWQSAAGGQDAAANAAMPTFAATPPPLAAQTHLIPDPAAIRAVPPPAVLPPARPAAEPPRLERSTPGIPAPSGRTALGVRTVPVDPNVQSRFHLSEAQGAFVIGVVQDLPASKAGVPPGSVIVAINHQPVRSPQDLTQLVARGPVGTPVPLHYVLPGGESKQAEVVLQSLEQPLERALVGDGEPGRSTEPPALQPAPLTTRRVQQTANSQSTEPATLGRLEELLRSMNSRLEQMERRLERIESSR